MRAIKVACTAPAHIMRGRQKLGGGGEEELHYQSGLVTERQGSRERKKATLFQSITLGMLACISGLSLELATGGFHLLDGPSHPTCGSRDASSLALLQGPAALSARASKEPALDCKSVDSTSGVYTPFLVADRSEWAACGD